MTLATTDRSLPREIDEARGSLRERIAALHNADRLLKSRAIGPKVLFSELSDIVQTLTPLCESAGTLVRYATLELKADFAALALDLEVTAQSLGAELRELLKSGVNARSRLRLERKLHAHLRHIQASLEHLEWMVESTRAEGVAVSLGEILLSQPALPSEAATLEVLIVGPVHSALVCLPARVATKAIALFVSQTQRSQFLLRSTDSEHLLLPFDGNIPNTDERAENFRLARIAPLPSSLSVVSAVLARSGVAVDLSAGTLRFPAIAG